MTTGLRLTLAGLGLVVVTVVVGLTVVPTHVTLGAGSLRCGTVLSPDRTTEIAPLCDRAASNQLRAVLLRGGLLAAIALVPLATWKAPRPHVAVWIAWATVMLVAALLVLADVGWFVEYAPRSAFFDL